MITITADEKKIINKELPKVHIARTARQRSKRHHYYMAEDNRAMQLLYKIRGEQIVKEGKGV